MSFRFFFACGKKKKGRKKVEVEKKEATVSKSMAPFFFRSSDFQAFFLRLWCFWESFSLAEEKQREETPSLVKRALLAELSKDENLLARRAREEAKISFCEKMFAKRNQSKKKKTRVTQTSLTFSQTN